MFRRRNRLALTPLLLLVLILSSCGSDNGGSTSQSGGGNAPAATNTTGGAASDQGAAQPAGGEGMVDHLDFGGFGGGDNPQLNYNPFSPNALTSAYTFEPLMIVDTFNCKTNPWLATDYKWQDPQTLVFTIRDA